MDANDADAACADDALMHAQMMPANDAGANNADDLRATDADAIRMRKRRQRIRPSDHEVDPLTFDVFR